MTSDFEQGGRVNADDALARLMADGHFKVVGAVCDISSGQVRLLA
jgi:hypothetical protein